MKRAESAAKLAAVRAEVERDRWAPMPPDARAVTVDIMKAGAVPDVPAWELVVRLKVALAMALDCPPTLAIDEFEVRAHAAKHITPQSVAEALREILPDRIGIHQVDLVQSSGMAKCVARARVGRKANNWREINGLGDDLAAAVADLLEGAKLVES